MNNYIKVLHKTEKECKIKHNTDYSCLESLLKLYVRFWKYSRDSRHKKSYLRKILNTYIELNNINEYDKLYEYSINIGKNCKFAYNENNDVIKISDLLVNNIGTLSLSEIWKFYYEIVYKL